MADDEVTAHLLADDGVTPVRFRRTSEASWTNAQGFTIHPGDVVEFTEPITLRSSDGLTVRTVTSFQLT